MTEPLNNRPLGIAGTIEWATQRDAQLPQPNSEQDILPDASAAAERTLHMIQAPLEAENADLRHELATDYKTGLLNERAYKENLAQTIDTRKPGDVITVYVSDIDGFKGVNDTLGHDAGDELLDVVGQAFRATFKRETDTVARGSREQPESNSIARLGGDENAVTTVEHSDPVGDEHRVTDPEDAAKQQAERVNQELQKLLQGTKFESFPLRLSVGFSQYEEGDTAETLFAKADLAMFEVKCQGKIDKITEEDKEYLREVIPFMESKGARVESWLKIAVFGTTETPTANIVPTTTDA